MQKTLFKTLIALTFASTACFAQAAEHKVKMLNQGEDGPMVFEPGFVKAQPGDTITFISVDPAHNTHSRVSPEGGKSWKGAIDEKVSVTLDTEGVYVYQCDPHVSLGMVGVIQVGEATNLDQARKKAASMKKSMATNKKRLNRYLDQVQQ